MALGTRPEYPQITLRQPSEMRGLLVHMMMRDAKRRRLQDQQDRRQDEELFDDDWDEECVNINQYCQRCGPSRGWHAADFGVFTAD